MSELGQSWDIHLDSTWMDDLQHQMLHSLWHDTNSIDLYYLCFPLLIASSDFHVKPGSFCGLDADDFNLYHQFLDFFFFLPSTLKCACNMHACKAWLASFIDHWKGAYWASATFRLLFAQAWNVSECLFAILHLDHPLLPCFCIYCINEHCRMFSALFHGCTRPLWP